MDNLVTRQGPSTDFNLSEVSPARSGGRGIDGLYLKCNGDQFSDLVVAEAKFGTSTLNPATESGPQMSRDWISSRLESTAHQYADLAEEIRSDGLVPSEGHGLSEQWRFPGPDGMPVTLSRVESGFIARGTAASADDLSRHLDRLSGYLHEAAEGRQAYTAVLLRIRPDGDQIAVSAAEISDGGHASSDSFWAHKGHFDELPSAVKTSLSTGLRSALLEHGYEPTHVARLSDSLLENPQQLQTLTDSPEFIGVHEIGQGAMLGVLAGTGTGLWSFWRALGASHVKDRIHLASCVGSATALSVLGGHSAGEWATQGLIGTDAGSDIVSGLDSVVPGEVSAELLGSIGGAFVGSALFGTIMFAFGQTSAKTTQRYLARAGAKTLSATLATGLTTSAVGAFAAASTGTSIASLSGAAATNATMAWLGGGSIASGGFGMAGGAVVLTGVGAVAAIAAIAAAGFVFRLLDEAEQQRYVGGLIQLAK